MAAGLRTGVADLLPNVGLRPVPPGEDAPADTRLAALPVQLLPGPTVVPLNRVDGGLWSWLQFAWQWCPILLPIWGSVLVLLLGVALLLRQMLALDERRATFVSTVTHELRTPLTTFRMYVEMQRHGMIRDPDKLADYMRVLDEESGRLVHLVENVLAYAKLDQGRASARMQNLSATELMADATPALIAHAERQGLTLRVEGAGDAARVATDAGAVGQILFNLVDNACKCGRSERDPAMTLRVVPTGDCLELCVRDFGPGGAKAFAKRLFEPFSRAGDAAAGPQPGVGLWPGVVPAVGPDPWRRTAVP